MNQTGNSSHFDIVIVGAGAAGISAAHTLLAKGYKIAVVEASGRIGGRVWTDPSSYSIPCDVGAHWLHYGSENFYKDYGESNGFDIYPDARNLAVYDKEVTVEEGPDLIIKGLELMERAIEESVCAGIDMSLADATANVDHPMHSVAGYILGPWTMGKELEHLSLLDYAELEESTDWFCRQGFGTLVAHYGSTLPVSLNTTVTEIDWSGNSLKIVTDNGTIESKAVILTVSTGVLASDAITFKPTLPTRKVESFNSISMGHYEHIWLEFSAPIADSTPDVYIVGLADENDSMFSAFANASGSRLTYFDIGGDVAEQMSRSSQTDRIDFALGRLRSIFGNEIDRTFVKGSASSWATDPLTRGSYATARPGAFPMREALREPIADRIFFAGEACHRTMYASVAGAHLSGQEAAEQCVARAL